jgi:heavy metal efflux system protein
MGVPELAPVTTGLGEIYQYVIHPKKGSEAKYSAMDLRTMQDWIVGRQLVGIPGVAEVTGFGGITKQYEVSIDPNRLKAMDVTIPEIFAALKQNNENTGGAYIDRKPNAYFIRGIGMVKSFADIEKIVIKKSSAGIPVLINDVAKVQFGSPPRYGALTYNGEKEVVGGLVLMLKGANSNDVVLRVKERMVSIQKSLPEDIIVEPFLDRSQLVKRAIGTVETNLIEGALIVIFVLLLFLGNLRAGLIVASAIPLSLHFALGMMRLFGVSANLMSLGVPSGEKGIISFEKIPVAKGTTDVGYTEVTLLKEVPKGSKFVLKGAFFILAKLTNTEGHAH